LLRSDAWRALWLIILFSGSIFALLKNYLKPIIVYPVVVVLIWFDLGFVDSRYFTKDNYKRKRENAFAVATAADQEILKDKSYYRVYNLQSPFTEARTSYFHHSIGGYHGAKMRRYQDLYDSCISKDTRLLFEDFQKGNPRFDEYSSLNMLNAKYIVYGPDKENVILNPAANGPAWFVKEVVQVNSPAEELKKVGEINTNEVAVINGQLTMDNSQLTIDSLASIILLERTPSYLKYESESSSNGLAVFSEIYYPKGWRAFIDGSEVSILQANYVLRALEIPTGKHVIEFKFEPKPYVVGNKITMASGWLLLLVMLGCIGWNFKNPQ
jgi:Bacterial membrane protein YfhO